ncbi:hypothetical protein JTB14_017756 [Gonioctena quinquepunctata]|nr:hypothetical protein JTB14_017756 [Gonioctena quinquepunctata]
MLRREKTLLRGPEEVQEEGWKESCSCTISIKKVESKKKVNPLIEKRIIRKNISSALALLCEVVKKEEAGTNTVTKLIEQKKAQLVVIAHDVDPIELVLFLPALCRKMGVPYCIVKGKARSILGTGPTSTNLWNRSDEIRRPPPRSARFQIGGSRIAKIEKAKAKELAQKQG